MPVPSTDESSRKDGLIKMGNVQIDVSKTLEVVAKRKKNAAITRERVMYDLAAVLDKSMSVRELMEFTFAMADTDQDVAAQIEHITIDEVINFSGRSRPARRVVDKNDMQQTQKSILNVFRNADKPLQVEDVRRLVNADEACFRSAWSLARANLQRIGNGRATSWQAK